MGCSSAVAESLKLEAESELGQRCHDTELQMGPKC